MDEGAASARLALRSAHHLVCVRGPDTGLVLPLPCEIGREGTGLADPLLSRRHARVRMRGARTLLTDLGSRNGTALRWGPFTKALPAGRECALAPGSRILAGSDVFAVRARPASLSRREGRRRRGSALFLLPLVSLSLLVVPRLAGRLPRGPQFLPLLGLALAALLVTAAVLVARRRRRERDPGALALRLAMLAAASGHGGRIPEHCSLRIPIPSAKSARRADAGSPDAPRAIACIGPDGARMADGIAASLIARLGGAVLDLPDGRRLLFGHERALVEIIDSAPPHRVRSDPRATAPGIPRFRIGIAADIAQAPEWCEAILEADGFPLASAWWDQFGAEDPARALPNSLDLVPLLESAKRSGDDARSGLCAPIGESAQGLVRIDLVNDGPHALVAGTTGSGKSEALLTWLKALSSTYSPAQLRLILIDYKGGAAFAPLCALPHVEAVFTDLSADGTARAIRGLLALVRAREHEFAALEVPDYSARCALDGPALPPPRILVVVDEFASLIDAHPRALDAMNRICAQGRSLGIHLIASTQRPAGAIPASMRQNLDLRIALRCVTESDSIDLIGSPDAARLERIPGRAIIPGTGVVQFALGRRWSAPAWPVEVAPLPWAPEFPAAITAEELRLLSARPVQAGAVTGTPIALVDGIEDGAHHALEWSGGRIALRTDADEAGIGARAARSIGAVIALSLGMRMRSLDGACEEPASPADRAEDLLLELEAACDGRARVLVLPDLVEARRLLMAVYGPLRADELLIEGIRAAEAAGCVTVAAWAGGRSSGEPPGAGNALLSSARIVLSRSSDPFEMIAGAGPSPGAPLSKASGAAEGRGRRPVSGHHWWLRDPSGDSRLACLPLVDHRRAEAPREAVRPWAEARASAEALEEPVILIGPSWMGLDPPGGGSWLLLGDRENLAERALEAIARTRGVSAPRIRSLPSASWSQAVADEDSQLLVLNPSADAIRAFAHGSIPLPPALQHRCEDPRRGFGRIRGRWFRIGIVVPESAG